MRKPGKTKKRQNTPRQPGEPKNNSYGLRADYRWERCNTPTEPLKLTGGFSLDNGMRSMGYFMGQTSNTVYRNSKIGVWELKLFNLGDKSTTDSKLAHQYTLKLSELK